MFISLTAAQTTHYPLEQAQQLLEGKQYETLLSVAQSARREAVLRGDSAAYGLSLYYIGAAHGKLGHFAAAADSAAKALKFIPEHRMGLMFARTLSVAGSNFFAMGEEAKAQSYLLAALRHQDLLRENDPFTLTKIWTNLANLAIRANDLVKASAYLNKAAVLDSSNRERIPAIYHLRYNLKWRQGKWQEAMQAAMTQLQIAEKQKDTANIGFAIAALANMVASTNQYKAVFPYLSKGLNLCRAGKLPSATCDELNLRAGAIFFRMDSLPTAFRYMQLAKAAYAQDMDALAGIYSDLCAYYGAKNNLDSALWYVEEELRLLRQKDANSRFINYALLQKVDILIKQQQVAAAQKILRTILQRATRLKQYEIIEDVKTRLSELAEKRQLNPSLLDTALVKAILAGTDTVQIQKIEALSDFKLRYETEQRDLEIARQRIALLEASQKGQYLILWGLGATMLALAGGIAFFYNANRLLRVQKKALEDQEMARRKTEELRAFNYTVSHDLKAPLTNAEHFLTLLEAGQTKPDNLVGYLTHFKALVTEMRQMIDGIGAYSQADGVGLSPQPIRTIDLLARIVTRLTPIYPHAQTAVQYDQKFPDLYGDPILIQQVLTNLVENALKFTRQTEQPVIFIKGQRSGDVLSVQIRDNGRGFPSAMAEHIFALFHTVHGPEGYNSTGIGFAIVRRIMERHGGKVWAESEGSGKGAVFYLEFPVP